MAYPGGLGEHNARDTLSPQPAAYPTRRRTAVPARSHRLQSVRNATCRPGGAGRCRAAVLGNRMWWRPSAKGDQQLHRLHACLELRRHSWHGVLRLLCPTSDRPRSGGHRLGAVFASSHSSLKYTVYPPSQTYQQHALAGGGSGLWGSSCRPSACGRRSGPVPVAYGLHGRWGVAPVARRFQQARATVP